MQETKYFIHTYLIKQIRRRRMRKEYLLLERVSLVLGLINSQFRSQKREGIQRGHSRCWLFCFACENQRGWRCGKKERNQEHNKISQNKRGTIKQKPKRRHKKIQKSEEDYIFTHKPAKDRVLSLSLFFFSFSQILSPLLLHQQLSFLSFLSSFVIVRREREREKVTKKRRRGRGENKV